VWRERIKSIEERAGWIKRLKEEKLRKLAHEKQKVIRKRYGHDATAIRRAKQKVTIVAYFRRNNPQQSMQGHYDSISDEVLSPNTPRTTRKSTINMFLLDSKEKGKDDLQTDGVASRSGSCHKETPTSSLEILSFAP
jgi:hypothetical protein